MGIKLGFVTGARSEYELSRKLLYEIRKHPAIRYEIVVTGMHLLPEFGNTVSVIENDGHHIASKVPFFTGTDKQTEFSEGIKNIARVLRERAYDYVFVVGDRIEIYAAALAAHLCKVKIIHLGGGNITKGVDDNIYRYNITNLADIHFVASKNNYERLKQLPIINISNVYFTGNTSIDQISDFNRKPVSIDSIFPNLSHCSFALMTFHPVPNENLPEVMGFSISKILEYDTKVLLTYTNIDEGYENILNVINKWHGNERVLISKNLGAVNYYAALKDCLFVIGNSSSGITEAPYFYKQVLNVGSRQEGRDRDTGIVDIKPEVECVSASIENGFHKGWPLVKNNNIYGNGTAVTSIMSVLEKL